MDPQGFFFYAFTTFLHKKVVMSFIGENYFDDHAYVIGYFEIIVIVTYRDGLLMWAVCWVWQTF